MRIKGWDLSYFNSGEWQVCDERLKDLEKINRPVRDGYNPGRKALFAALRATPLESCRVAIIGQDPYPSSAHATGLAFSIPESIPVDQRPPTLECIFTEYSKDLHYPRPSSGNLERWCQNGVLLWNAIPSTTPGKSLAHDWPEYEPLTREIVTQLSNRGVTFALLGQVARRYLDSIDLANNNVILTSHPSPRGSANSRNPFQGSRLFSAINDKLVNNGQEMIDWKLP